jgi:hypothetical protein
MVANFRSFLAELRQLNGTKQGAGYKLGKCADQAAEFAGAAAMGDDNKVEYVYHLVSWMDEVDASFEGCQAEMKAIPDADKLLPTEAVMYPASILVAQDLVSGYTPPQSQMYP